MPDTQITSHMNWLTTATRTGCISEKKLYSQWNKKWKTDLV